MHYLTNVAKEEYDGDGWLLGLLMMMMSRRSLARPQFSSFFLSLPSFVFLMALLTLQSTVGVGRQTDRRCQKFDRRETDGRTKGRSSTTTTTMFSMLSSESSSSSSYL